MSIWFQPFTVADINNRSKDTMMECLDMRFTEVGDDYLVAEMPVDRRHRQITGILHGGASVALAESLGSCAAFMCVDQRYKTCVGLDINANHVRAVRDGMVRGTARALHIGRSTHVWEIRIETPGGKLVCVSRLTMAILDQRRKNGGQ